MKRNDGPSGLYSDNKWHLGEGQGDIEEIKARRTWRKLGYWQSDGVLSFGRPFKGPNTPYRRTEYLYIGRSKDSGELNVASISIQGPHKRFFTVWPKSAKVPAGRHLRIKVSYSAPMRKTIKGLSASIVIANNISGVRRIRIIGEE